VCALRPAVFVWEQVAQPGADISWETGSCRVHCGCDAHKYLNVTMNVTARDN
jgi:hypothetical protein